MKVYLLGAGPGDPGLLTLKAKSVIERADVIVYDYLANESFLEFRNPDAEVIYVGKKGGDHTKTQDEINALLVERAKRGKMVARLKGGDPYMFGRGAEEAEELLDAGVDFEVVPGVTSAIAGPAYAGVPLTHRRYASSVSFITGHEDPDKPESAHNWKALASGTSTLVFFMGMKNLPDIASKLMENGMPGDMEVCLVRWGTTCNHRSHVGKLSTIARDAEQLGFTAPSLIVVGRVCALHDTLNFFEKKPLLGKGVVVTRARHQASSLVALLEEQGACVTQFPTIEIQPLDDYVEVEEAILTLAQYDWLVFTSVNGVSHFFEQLMLTGLDSRILGGCEVAAIGPATAEALEKKGIRPDFVPEKYVAESVVKGLLEKGIAGKKVLIPRALKAREVLPQELAKAGAEVRVLPVYETVIAKKGADRFRERLAQGEIDCVTFASSSTVDNFFEMVQPDIIKAHKPRLKLACIGPVTAKTLEGYGLAADIQPEDYTLPALVKALVKEL